MTAGQRLARIDAVTIDAFGTLLELRDPVESLARPLPGFERSAIDRAFKAEVDHYVPRAHEGRDPESLARLRAASTDVFNRELGSSLTPEAFIGALEFDYVEGAVEAVDRLRARGLALCVVSNWDISLHERLAGLGLPIVTSAEAGAPKPDPTVFLAALERLGVRPERTLHIGDGQNDAKGAARAGLMFTPAPLAEALAAWT